MEIDPRHRSTKYCLVYSKNDTEIHLPPKAVARRANIYANGEELWDFSGGKEANQFCEEMGFKIIVHGGAPQPEEGVIFGEIPGYPPGSLFSSRYDLYVAGLHRQTMAGISGSVSAGADSIVLSGGHEDDEDHGDRLIYTGQGGNKDGKQVADETFTRGNYWLAVSQRKGPYRYE